VNGSSTITSKWF